MKSLNLKVTEVIVLSPTTKAIRLGLDRDGFDFIPGQFIILEINLAKTGKFKVIDKDPIQKRAYSISSLPTDPFIELTVKKMERGFVSDYLVSHLNIGYDVKIVGPYGKFYFDEKDTKKNLCIIGMGSGACPLMSILRHINSKEIPVNAHYLFSASYENELLWRKEIEGFNSGRITHEFTITKEKPENWKGHLGRIDREMIEKSIKQKEETDFYLCGSPEFVEGIIKILKDMRIDEKNIKREIYS